MRYRPSHFLFFIFSCLVILILTVVIVQNNFRPFYNRADSPAPTSILQPLQTAQNSEAESPDGTMKLVLKTQTQPDGNNTYSIFIETTAGENRKLLFTTTGRENFSLSPNSWSPDNVYVFLTQKRNNGVNVLVFKANGDPFVNNLQYVDLSSYFEKTLTDRKIIDVTGWDATTLLHVKTQVVNSSEKGSYWFDVTNFSFIQL